MELLVSLWNYIVKTAPLLLLGLVGAGLVHSFASLNWIKSHLGGNGLWPILKAAFLGIPLPLCSCAVVPTAVELRKSGVGNAPTSSFLISTPESGIDSIAVTYALMDLPLTILRPLSAFITSLMAGVFQKFFNDYKVVAFESSCCGPSSSKENKIVKGLKYGLFDLADDLSVWLFIGLFLGGVLDYFLPLNYFGGLNEHTGKFLILLVGIPLYICASATTPIAAALVAKGMPPGTALILLLVGPATNISNIAVLQKYIGKKGVLINIIIIAVVSLVLSYVVDFLYTFFSWELNFRIVETHHHTGPVFDQFCGALLVALLIKGVGKKLLFLWRDR